MEGGEDPNKEHFRLKMFFVKNILTKKGSLKNKRIILRMSAGVQVRRSVVVKIRNVI